MYNRPLILSIFLHTILLIGLAKNAPNPGEEGPGGSGAKPPVVMKIIPKPKEEDTEVAAETKDKSNIPIPKKDKKDEEKKCEHFYYGVGVYMDSSGVRIHEVMSGYPAWSAGLEAGDWITEGYGNLRGPVGKPVTIKVFRGLINSGSTFTVTMIREKICERIEPQPTP